jgi:hypothetical protein
MSLPVFPEFKSLEIGDRAVLAPFFERFPLEISESTFGNHFIWRRFDHPSYTTIHGNLCLHFAPPCAPPYFLQPLGETDVPDTIAVCLSHAPRLSRIPASFAERWCKGFRCGPDRDDYDYVYASSDLAELKGKKYDGKRNRIRKFEKEHPWSYVPLTPAHLEACHRLFEEWMSDKEPNGGSVDAQKDAISEALLHYEALGMVGGAIETGGRIRALALGEKLNADTAVIHIEIADPGLDGLSQLMNREFVRNAWSGCAFINREQDLGLPGLRKAKLSYHPVRLEMKHTLTFRG